MQTLTLRNFSGVPEITPEAQKLKAEALALAVPVKQVTNPDEQKIAVAALSALKTFRAGIEDSRKMVKRPVLDLGSKIDDIAAKVTRETDKAENRLLGLINHYQRKQIEEQRAEEARLAAEAAEAKRLRDAAEAEADPAKREQLQAAALDAELSTELVTVSDIDKPRGLVVRKRLDFEVTDPVVFCQGFPQYWKPCGGKDKPNEKLRVDRMAILEELNKEGGGLFHKSRFPEEVPLPVAAGEIEIPTPLGLRVFEDLKTHIR